ncbi:hypothetical protein [Actinoplanes sp. NPDC026623]|uniref:hypothetical protein n=1 Tax=Actinoplanes sp. NPDC026623 TaxID=3155610 RepID=UPI0034001FC5
MPEWGCLLVYTPARPNVHYLDARSWLIYELCDGRGYGELLAEFSEAVPEGTTQEQVVHAVDKGLTALVDNGIVERTDADDRAAIEAGAG